MGLGERGGLKLFVVLFLFGLAILSAWLGLTNQTTRFSGWYLGALFFAILGIIVLKLPTSHETQEGK